MAYDFLLDEKTNDLYFENGLFKLTNSEAELLNQRLTIRLRAWVEEWFLDGSFGIPYRQKLLNGVASKEEIDSEFLNVISSYDAVNYIVSFESTVNSEDRSYSLNFTVHTDEGEETFSIFSTPTSVEIIYPPSHTYEEYIPGVDTTAPIVSLGKDISHDGTGQTFEINSTMIVEANLSSVSYNWDGGSDIIISLPFEVTTPTGEADHVLNVTATDRSENTGTDSKKFNYVDPVGDTTDPVVSLGGNIIHDGTGLTFTILPDMIFELNPGTTTYSFDGGPETHVIFPQQINIPSEERNYSLVVTATDTSGNIGSDEKIFIYPTLSECSNTPTINKTAWDDYTTLGDTYDRSYVGQFLTEDIEYTVCKMAFLLKSHQGDDISERVYSCEVYSTDAVTVEGAEPNLTTLKASSENTVVGTNIQTEFQWFEFTFNPPISVQRLDAVVLSVDTVASDYCDIAVISDEYFGHEGSQLVYWDGIGEFGGGVPVFDLAFRLYESLDGIYTYADINAIIDINDPMES